MIFHHVEQLGEDVINLLISIDRFAQQSQYPSNLRELKKIIFLVSSKIMNFIGNFLQKN
jgi:hypothetical protein